MQNGNYELALEILKKEAIIAKKMLNATIAGKDIRSLRRKLKDCRLERSHLPQETKDIIVILLNNFTELDIQKINVSMIESLIIH